MRSKRRRSAPLSLRGVVTVFALLAFVFEGFATQTHIHVPGQFAASSAATQIAQASPSRDAKPGAPADDPAHCPLCQEFLLSGAYLAPAPVALPVPILTEALEPLLVAPLAAIQAVSHDWRGRAPPLD